MKGSADMSEFIYSVPLGTLIKELHLEVAVPADDTDTKEIIATDVLRPGLQLASGVYDYFDKDRISIIGKMETSYLLNQSPEKRKEKVDELFAKGIPAVIVTHGLEVLPEAIDAAKKYGIPVLTTEVGTSAFMASLIASLHLHLAPRITRHGVLVEVYGEGILMLGESGVGKSETAIELVKRGHRLVADDAVEIKKVSSKTLVGSAPSIIKHFVELRGIGIVDVQKIFGMGAVKDTEKIDFILHLEAWKDGKTYDRLGLETEYTDLLGVNIPSITIPVKPGRNLAVIVEVAAMNSRQKKMGYNAAKELNKRWTAEMTDAK